MRSIYTPRALLENEFEPSDKYEICRIFYNSTNITIDKCPCLL